MQPPPRTAKHPCVACAKNVTGASVQCTVCTMWCHMIIGSGSTWICIQLVARIRIRNADPDPGGQKKS
jgi:hypothetical protein